MIEKDNGGAAFPSPNDVTFETSRDTFVTGGHSGMTLRDWFAGKALAGILSTDPVDGGSLDDAAKALAVGVYAIADAMLEARK